MWDVERPPLQTPLQRMVLGLGSNLGDRAGNIASAMRAVGRCPGIEWLAAAPLYETPPFGGPPQGPYLNSAILVRTALSPREVLSRTLEIERSLGRVRPDPIRWGPRTIDIDLLWAEGQVVDERELVVPHPGLHERPFALRPLLDLVPDAADPRTGTAYAVFPAASARIERWGEPPRRDAADDGGRIR